MGSYSVAQAKAHLSALLDRVEKGEEIVITRRGQPIARLSLARWKKRPIDWAKIDAFRDSLPATGTATVEMMRKRSRY